MMKKEFLKTDHLKLVVLDEADEMLGRGFEE
jgi:superfamily II DNA/RNA helicase